MIIEKNIRIKDMANDEKPRERLMSVGVSNLSNEELISIILKNGTKGYSVKQISSLVMSEYKNLDNLKNITVNKLSLIKGIGKVKAIELVASLELGKRVYYKKEKTDIILNNSELIYEYFKDLYYHEKQENFYAIYLDTKNKLISYRLLFKGTLDSSSVHPREIFKYAFLESAHSIIVMHNHPSGDATPSNQDIEITKHLIDTGKIIGIPVIDHIIIGNEKYYSFYENMNNLKYK